MDKICPQEDSGGIWGHQQVLEALLIPDHPEKGETVEWLQAGYDPEQFLTIKFDDL